jgi:hypothetical protein
MFGSRSSSLLLVVVFLLVLVLVFFGFRVLGTVIVNGTDVILQAIATDVHLTATVSTLLSEATRNGLATMLARL